MTAFQKPVNHVLLDNISPNQGKVAAADAVLVDSKRPPEVLLVTTHVHQVTTQTMEPPVALHVQQELTRAEIRQGWLPALDVNLVLPANKDKRFASSALRVT